ncbi:energy transducer TonB [Rhodobacter calidifons]|uniref:TonB family protein n=1 Tax=Rhodobacter calidifons TaxID=2715277 RepID=A0ABX0G885_9RHOB|nr:energy transducer TonB [Rhodobacter calidifons]NHB77495.1 TonB family protein [Rhodobacter calidifons]
MRVRGAMVFGALSVLAHLGGAMILGEPDGPEIAGTAPAAARLGNSFADVAAGSAVSVPGLATATPTPAALAPDPAPDAALVPVETQAETAAPAEVPATVPATLPPPLAPVPPEAAATVSLQEPIAEVAPAAIPQGTAVPPETLRAALAAPLPAALTPAPPRETIPAVDPATALATSPRPRPRQTPETSVRVAPTPEAAPERKTKAKPKPSSAAEAGAAEAERKGLVEGTEQGTLSEAPGKGPVASETGNAAASNYPGSVMRKISRTRKPQVGARGTAVVGFEIAANGSLASVRILTSSGNEAIDAAAVDHLRRAAPFPVPPAGAQRRFQVAYESRG